MFANPNLCPGQELKKSVRNLNLYTDQKPKTKLPGQGPKIKNYALPGQGPSINTSSFLHELQNCLLVLLVWLVGRHKCSRSLPRNWPKMFTQAALSRRILIVKRNDCSLHTSPQQVWPPCHPTPEQQVWGQTVAYSDL